MSQPFGPDSARLAPSLQRWCVQNPVAEQKTAIVKPSYSVDLKEAVRTLRRIGAEIQSSGQEAITIVVSPESLAQVAKLPWVVFIEEPRRLYARAALAG